MSFINKALERAKALHKQGKPSPVPPREMDAPKFSPLVEPESFGQTAPPLEITYTFTRTVAIDPKTLHRYKVIAGADAGPAGEEYKLLRTKILQTTKREGSNTLMVTGPKAGEGKTLTALNLAITISHEIRHTVLLVDVDLRLPSVHKYLGIPQGPGLIDHLISGVPLSELLVHPEGLAKLVVLPAGRQAGGAAELIGSPAMATLVHELKHYYPDRYVIFDLPPLLPYADALAFAPLVGGIILVVEAERTSRENIQACLNMLRSFPVLGFVLNKAKTPPESYYYDYHQYRKNDKPSKKFKSLWLR